MTNKAVILHGPKVDLVPLGVRLDYPAWRDLRGENRNWLQPWEPIWPDDALTEDYYLGLALRYAQAWMSGTAYSFQVYLRGNGTFIGGVTLHDVARECFQKATLCYWVSKQHTRQTFMTEATMLICDFAFTTLKLHRIEAHCSPYNEPSVRLLKRLGFAKEGLAKGYMRVNGEWQDQILWSKIRT